MANYQLTTDELIYNLKEQLYFIDSSLTNFSNHLQINSYSNKHIGQPIEAHLHSEIESKRIATAVRILVHDTNNSTSLLHSIRIKEKVKYLDSSNPNDGRLHSMTGMRGVVGSKSDAYLGLVAKINTGEKLIAAPLFLQHLKDWYSTYAGKEFSDWWTAQIYSHNGDYYTRKELILALANKDGGAHVDPEQPGEYKIAKNSPLRLNINGVQTEFDRNVVYASAAQIGWELLNSINCDHLKDNHSKLC